jgi:DNA invertase Pin-like site-specific DNA recombinase
MSAHRGKFVAYFRVSTDRQGKSGLGLEAQREAVLDYLNGGSWQLVAEFTEVESGKHADRPQLAAALAACRKNKARLVIAKLDRLSRNLAFIAALMDSGVEFVAVDNPHANKLTVHILAAVAQHEREAISERTRAALAAAKARGVKLGNPRLAEAREGVLAARVAAADAFAANVRPIIKEIQTSGVGSLRGVAKALTARGVATARGGVWTAVQVSDVLRRGLRKTAHQRGERAKARRPTKAQEAADEQEQRWREIDEREQRWQAMWQAEGRSLADYKVGIDDINSEVWDWRRAKLLELAQ